MISQRRIIDVPVTPSQLQTGNVSLSHTGLFDLSPRFDGADYVPAHDQLRLTGQLKRVWDVICDTEWHTLREIATATGDPESSVSAQLRHLRKQKFGGHTIERQPRGERSRGLYEYRLVAS